MSGEEMLRVLVATYRAISGSGATAAAACEAQEEAELGGTAVGKSQLSGQLSRNLPMHSKPDAKSGYQEEELWMSSETQAAWGRPQGGPDRRKASIKVTKCQTLA